MFYLFFVSFVDVTGFHSLWPPQNASSIVMIRTFQGSFDDSSLRKIAIGVFLGTCTRTYSQHSQHREICEGLQVVGSSAFFCFVGGQLPFTTYYVLLLIACKILIRDKALSQSVARINPFVRREIEYTTQCTGFG